MSEKGVWRPGEEILNCQIKEVEEPEMRRQRTRDGRDPGKAVVKAREKNQEARDGRDPAKVVLKARKGNLQGQRKKSGSQKGTLEGQRRQS